MGDSKSISSNSWGATLLTTLNALDNPGRVWTENEPRGWAVGGATAASLKAGIDTEIALHSVTPLERNVFLSNIGANDSGSPNRAQWKSDYQYIIDAIVAKWSDAQIYLAKPWRRNNDIACDSLAVWIDELVASNSTTCHAGHDERVWLEGGDNGATMTTDGVHYSMTGQAECANQWKTILGY